MKLWTTLLSAVHARPTYGENIPVLIYDRNSGLYADENLL